jgi:hypothetical protein
VPLFFVAWPVAIMTGHLALTFAVFVGVYVATKIEPRAGAAYGKLMCRTGRLCAAGVGDWGLAGGGTLCRAAGAWRA